MNAKELGMQLAYPLQSDGVSHGSEPGLTKREAFAMAAMQGILANNEFGKQMRQSSDIIVGDTISRLSMQCADSMLAELAKEPT